MASAWRMLAVLLLVAGATLLAAPWLSRLTAAVAHLGLSTSLADPLVSHLVSTEPQVFRAESAALGLALEVRDNTLLLVFAVPLAFAVCYENRGARRCAARASAALLASLALSGAFLAIFVEAQFAAAAVEAEGSMTPVAAAMVALFDLLGREWSVAYLVVSGVWLSWPRADTAQT